MDLGTDRVLLYRIKNQTVVWKRTGSRLETLLKEVGTPRKSSFKCNNKQPSLSSLSMGRQEGSLHPFALQGTDKNYLLEEIDASLVIQTGREKAFSEKVYQGLELEKRQILRHCQPTIRAYNPSSKRQIGPDQEGYQLSYREGKTYLLELELPDGSLICCAKSQLDPETKLSKRRKMEWKKVDRFKENGLKSPSKESGSVTGSFRILGLKEKLLKVPVFGAIKGVRSVRGCFSSRLAVLVHFAVAVGMVLIFSLSIIAQLGYVKQFSQ